MYYFLSLYKFVIYANIYIHIGTTIQVTLKVLNVPHFHGKNPVKFCVWCAVMHRQGFMPMYMTCINMLTCVAYTGKSMSLANIDQDNHTTMITHTIWHQYAPMTVALSAYPHHKVKSNHNYEKVTLLTMGVHYTKCTIIHKQACAHTHTQKYTLCTMQTHKVPRVWPSKVRKT